MPRYLIALALFWTACNQPSPAPAQTDNIPSAASGQLVHTVYFKLKPGADQQAMIRSLETLKAVEAVSKLEIGTWLDTGQPGLLSGYSIVAQLTFDDLAAFRAYEKHPAHLASIDATKDLLAGPPIGYDYIRK
jgi:hypothetical protein